MAVWERYDLDPVLSTQGSHSNTEVFHNEETSDNFQSADVAIVDGIITVITDTDDLVGVRLLIADEIIATGSLTEDDPEPHNNMVYYSWFAARGPLVFRLRSKRLIRPEQKLWCQVWKARGTASTTIRVGLHLLFVVKH